MATGAHALDANAHRGSGQPELDRRFWSRRDNDLRNFGLFYKWEIEPRTSFAVAVIVDRLDRRLKVEAHLMKTNHWTYCVARHDATIGVLRNERALLQRLESEGL